MAPRPKDWEYQPAAPAFEQQERHVAVLSIICIEQGELLGTVCVGVRVVSIDDDGIGFRIIRNNEIIHEAQGYVVQLFLGQPVLQPGHGGLRRKVCLVIRRAAAAHLEYAVATEPVAVIRILVSGGNLADALRDKRLHGMHDEVGIACVADTGNDTVNDVVAA